MYIDPDSYIAGLGALKVRKFFLSVKHTFFNIRSLMDYFDISERNAKQKLRELINLGYIEKAVSIGGEDYWKTTLKGNALALALASAAKPIRRATADTKLQELINRIAFVNKNDYFLLKVSKAVVFGSYLSERERINDIDVAIELKPKIRDRDLIFANYQERIKEAIEAGRQFANITEQVCWPYTEIFLYLKARSRALSIHGIEDLKIVRGKKKIIYP